MSKPRPTTPQVLEKIGFPLAVGYLKTSPIGPISVWATPQGLIRLTIGPVQTITPQNGDQTAQAILDQALEEVAAYLAGQRRQFTVPINWQVISPKSRPILEYTYTIPYGEVRTYGEIAHRLGRPNAARAVGSAMAHNPIPLIIPCHRVIGSDRSLHGYGGGEGIPTKAWLLQLEGHRIVGQRVV
jgi:methylated-DNA-[protein]-cysteine S-methyltransferase